MRALGARRNRVTLGLVVAIVLAAGAARALEDGRFRVSGRAVMQGREFPAQLRVWCIGPTNVEVQLAVLFANGAEAAGSDVFFPFGDFEGPDGKPAPIALEVTSAGGKSIKHRFMSAAGWFGVEDEYLFSFKPADGKRLVAEGATATSIAASIVAGRSSIAFTFPEPSAVLGKAAAACK